MNQFSIFGKNAHRGRQVLLSFVLVGSIVTNVMALRPEFNIYGWLYINAEYAEGQMYTGYWSIVGGTETWLYKYYGTINTFCYGNDQNNYWTTLPYYGYTLVTAQKLANMIWYDNALGLNWVPSAVVNKIAWALQADHNSNHKPPKAPNADWDPISDWKWRSNFMEGRYAENGSYEQIMSNCWGNADYLTRSFKWSDGYPTYKQMALNAGYSQFGASFPHIYLDGCINGNLYSIDGDLQTNNWRFALKGTGNISGGLKNLLNSFDVIRMSSPTYAGNPNELVWNGTRLGVNAHCTAYLCTDQSGNFSIKIG